VYGEVLLYPVQGPLSTQTPSPVFPGKLSGGLNSGGVSFVIGDGEVFKGGWTRVIPVKSTQGAAMVSSPQSEGMPAAWDRVYGSGFYVAHVLGAVLYARAVITGNRGTVLQLEFYSPSPGVAARLLGGRERQQRQPLQTDSKRSLTRPRAGSDEFQNSSTERPVSAMIARSSGFLRVFPPCTGITVRA